MIVSIDVDFDQFETIDLIEEIENRGFKCVEENKTIPFEDVKQFVRENNDSEKIKELLYEYAGIGHFNDLDTLLQVVKEKLS